MSQQETGAHQVKLAIMERGMAMSRHSPCANRHWVSNIETIQVHVLHGKGTAKKWTERSAGMSQQENGVPRQYMKQVRMGHARLVNDEVTMALS